ncbi:MAG TPA: S8 family serine peptidase [Solirubrobacteraceae bacterium]|nr:S8 family serine peptidase [Solirubrobacteraceae bacterium]
MRRTTWIGLVVVLAALATAPAAAAAPAEYDAHTVIVKYADDASSAQRSAAGRLAGVLERLGSVRGIGADVVRVTGDPAAVAARLNGSPAVLYAEPNFIAHTTAIPNDPLFDELYGLHNIGQDGGVPDADIDAPEGWDAAGLADFPATLNGAKIGIIDTGVLASHEDLAGKVVDCAGVRSFGIDLLGLITLPLFVDTTIVGGRCADDNGHGTHVAGTAAATANNGRGVAGVAFNSPLAICKAMDSTGAGPVSGIANCLAYLVGTGAKVISMSLGSAAESEALRDAVAEASRSALIVAAAGNSGDSTLEYPAGYPEVVSVAATDRNDRRSAFSTVNAKVELAAPGEEILSTWNDGAYETTSGTSMATPHVAGVAALVADRHPSGGPAAWRATLVGSVDDLGPAGRDPQFGFGRVNLAKAVAG